VLTADLVVARRYKGELRLRALRPDEEAAARELALALVREAHAHVGQSRERLVAAWEALPGGALDNLPKSAMGGIALTDLDGRFVVPAPTRDLASLLFAKDAKAAAAHAR